MAKKAFCPLSSGPGDESIAPPNARRKTGVHWMTSGSSVSPTRSRSAQNASIRAFSARQKSRRSSAAGCSAATASSTPRTSRSSVTGIGSSGRQTGHRSRASRTSSARTVTYSRSASARIRSGVRSSDRIVWRILAANNVRPIRPSPSLAGSTTSRRCASKAASASRAVSAAAESRGASAATAGSVGAAESADSSASEISASMPASWRRAVSVWNRPTGTSSWPTSLARAASRSCGSVSRRPAVDASRSASGANSRALSVNRPSPTR